jgi:O-acetyl-ADP-ribose deacetylase (regulator of RNase III)
MITEQTGDLLKVEAEALVNPVNCVGTMGKGLALQFRGEFHENYDLYREACGRNEVRLGEMFVYETHFTVLPKYIINFPTKQHWRQPSELRDIKSGLTALVRTVRDRRIKSIAIPRLGCGNGGLKWDSVRPLIVEAFTPMTKIQVLIISP